MALLLCPAASVASMSAAAACAPPCYELATAAPIAAVAPRILSVTMDGHAFDRGREPMDFWRPGSKLPRALAGALQPGRPRRPPGPFPLLTGPSSVQR